MRTARIFVHRMHGPSEGPSDEYFEGWRTAALREITVDVQEGVVLNGKHL